MKIELFQFVKKLKAEFGIRVWVIRCDNTKGNADFKREVEHERFGLRFEYTAGSTPQQNCRVERKFQAMYGSVRSMLLDCTFKVPVSFGLWVEAGTTTATLDGI